MNQVVNKYRTQELMSSVKTLNREIRLLQAERKAAPTFSFRQRMKAEIAEEICRLEDRRAEYVRQLNEAKRVSRRLRRHCPTLGAARELHLVCQVVHQPKTWRK